MNGYKNVPMNFIPYILIIYIFMSEIALFINLYNKIITCKAINKTL